MRHLAFSLILLTSYIGSYVFLGSQEMFYLIGITIVLLIINELWHDFYRTSWLRVHCGLTLLKPEEILYWREIISRTQELRPHELLALNETYLATRKKTRVPAYFGALSIHVICPAGTTAENDEYSHNRIFHEQQKK